MMAVPDRALPDGARAAPAAAGQAGEADAVIRVRDLKAMGASNMLTARSRKPVTRDLLSRAIEIYAERFAGADGGVRATFEILTLTAWAPHESQQKPLKPGSAEARLADALGVTERKLDR